VADWGGVVADALVADIGRAVAGAVPATCACSGAAGVLAGAAATEWVVAGAAAECVVVGA